MDTPHGSGDGAPPSAELTTAERRKRKKELKKALRGSLSASVVLSNEDIARLYGTAAAAFEYPPHLQARLHSRSAAPAVEDGAEIALEADADAAPSSSAAPRTGAIVDADDIQSLILWLVHAVPSPNWVFVRNKALIRACVCVFLHGATHADVQRHIASGAGPSWLRSCTLYAFRVPRGIWRSHARSLNDAADAVLHMREGVHARAPTHAPHAGMKRARTEVDAAADIDASTVSETERSGGGRSVCVCDLTLRRAELVAHGFPLPGPPDDTGADAAAANESSTPATLSLPPGYCATTTCVRDVSHTHTHTHAHSHTRAHTDAGASAATTPPDTPVLPSLLGASPRLLGVDCEMVRTSSGSQIARVSVVGEDGGVVMDEFVRPQEAVLDHLTAYSGVRPGDLERAVMSLSDVQAALTRVIDGDGRAPPAVLVGHSLENDLHALKLAHSRIIDTSILHPHPGGLPYRHSLRHLARQHLNMHIQQSHGADGHSSVEDAWAALQLVLRLLPAADARSPDAPAPTDDVQPNADFIAHFHANGREDMLPVPGVLPPWLARSDDTPDAAPTTPNASRGVAAVLAALTAPASAANAPSVAPTERRDSWQLKRRRKSLFAYESFSDGSIASSCLIGPAEWIRHHVGGRCDGIPIPAGDSSFRRTMDRCAVEVQRCISARESGRAAGMGLVFAHTQLPATSATAAPLASVDGLLAEFAARLSPGCAIMLVLQHPTGDVSDARDRDMLTSGCAASLGALMLSVTSSASAPSGPAATAS